MANNVTRLAFLKESHRKLDKDIQKGYNSFIDDIKLADMKVQKLRLKEQIEKLEQELKNESNG